MSFSTIKSFDPYNALDLDRTASIDDVKSRFRTLTLKYHPDRNRRKRGYNPKVYSDICKAYAILSNPESRKDFDRQFAPSWLDMREGTRDFTSTQQKQSRTLTELQAERDDMSQPSRFAPRQKFGEGDLSSFNDAFDKSRTSDPMDHGYGDEMTERMSEQQAKTWSSSVSDIRQENMFKGQSFSQQEFNRLFEEGSTRDSSRDIIERSEIDPSAFSLASQHAFTDIAIHDGHMIVGRDTRDYTKHPSTASDLSWVDYKQGFQTISSQVPDNIKKQYDNNESLDRRFQQRMAEHSSNPYDDIPENDRKSFSQAKQDMIQRQFREREREEKMHRDVVLKYKSQYRDNYLDHKPGRGSEQPHPSEYASQQPPSPSQQPPSQQPPSHLRQPVERSNRINRYQPQNHTNIQSSSSNFNQQTRDTDENIKSINDRMNERNFML